VQYFLLILWPGELETLHLLGEKVIPVLQSGSVLAESSVFQTARRRWLPWGQ
jgi:hypothetical protein